MPAPHPLAAEVFGDRVDLATQFAMLLATAGVERGLIGPREAPRLWDRHLLNCAVVTELLPVGARVVDVGSGAGLPGVVLAIRRPDLQLELVESMQRRTEFLVEAVATLGLQEQVRVVRGRAEDPATVSAVHGAPWVTARAVAPLDRLVRWCLPLLSGGGSLLAIKGAQAVSEVAEHAAAVRHLTGEEPAVVLCGVGVVPEPTTVVVVRKESRAVRAPRRDAG